MRTTTPIRLAIFSMLTACASDDDDDDDDASSSSQPTQSSSATIASSADDDDDGSADDDGAADDAGGIDCAFPNDPSICGCGNACVGNPDSAAYGTCVECGSGGTGCATQDVWCCSDGDCPSGMLCTTLSSSPDVGYHLCVATSDLDACTTLDDCYPAEDCADGYCRDGE